MRIVKRFTLIVYIMTVAIATRLVSQRVNERESRE